MVCNVECTMRVMRIRNAFGEQTGWCCSSSGGAIRMETQHTCRCPGLVLVDDRPPPPPPADHPGVTSATDSACGLCSLTNCTTEQFLR